MADTAGVLCGVSTTPCIGCDGGGNRMCLSVSGVWRSSCREASGGDALSYEESCPGSTSCEGFHLYTLPDRVPSARKGFERGPASSLSHARATAGIIRSSTLVVETRGCASRSSKKRVVRRAGNENDTRRNVHASRADPHRTAGPDRPLASPKQSLSILPRRSCISPR